MPPNGALAEYHLVEDEKAQRPVFSALATRREPAPCVKMSTEPMFPPEDAMPFAVSQKCLAWLLSVHGFDLKSRRMNLKELQ
mmetsp:Transcript_58617/g.119309  ORF Transcript_58617/g.119309 Transcript_58617/m.119309 type:complete len:82 (-) Transcript_58617:174-419(-)